MPQADEQNTWHGAEERLLALGIPLEQHPNLREGLEPDELGLLIACYDVDDQVSCQAYVREGVDQFWRDVFAEWVDQRMALFEERGGPVPDDWRKRRDGAWMTVCAITEWPDLDPWLI